MHKEKEYTYGVHNTNTDIARRRSVPYFSAGPFTGECELVRSLRVDIFPLLRHRLLWLQIYGLQNSVVRIRTAVISCLLFLLLLVSCGGPGGERKRTSGAGSEAAIADTTTITHTHKLDLPIPPAILSEGEQLEFVAEHYWDSFDFADTTWCADTAALVNAFVPWAALLGRLPQERAAALSGDLIRRAETEPAMLLCLSEAAERFFYEVNSPYRNEELYIPVLEALLASRTIDTIYQIRPRAQLDLAMKNRPGMRAADFVYTRGDGTTGRLYGLDAEYTLLLFYVPDCPNCAAVERYIVSSEVFTSLTDSERLKVLAVYPGGDPELWREHLSQMPADWIVGRDAQRVIDNSELYDIRATPSLYLLDREKMVVLKDARVERIEAWLYEQS